MTTVFVTGANRGIGLEFTRQYSADGAHVVATCRAPDKAAELRALADSSDGRIEIMTLDVTDAASVALIKRALEGRPIDILINNAGVMGGRKQSFGDLDYHAWSQCLEVNVMGPMRVSEALIDNVASGTERKIVILTSKMGSIADASGGAYIYRTSKTAVNMAARLMAADLKDKGIVLLPVHPGWVKTDMGGPNALITTEESVSGLRALIARATVAESGRYRDYSGAELPW